MRVTRTASRLERAPDFDALQQGRYRVLLGSTSELAMRGPDDDIAPDLGPVRDQLLACVRKAFPTLPVGKSRVENAGGDHVLLIVDEAFVFRFPREGMHDLKLEIEVLRLLQRRSVVPIPSYDFIDPQGRFAGYRFIEGVELTQPRFSALGSRAKERVLGAAADFLSQLHGLLVEEVAWSGTWPTMWTGAEFVERGLAERLPLIARHAPHLAVLIEAFYDHYRQDRSEHVVVVHGDLVADHILLDGAIGRIGGIIDFGDVAIGDPAHDFLGFWIYGAAAVARIIALYRAGGDDPGLLVRSRNHFIRYRIDRLFENLLEGPGEEFSRDTAEIAALLDAVGRADQRRYPPPLTPPKDRQCL